jgi:hypothetical protein
MLKNKLFQRLSLWLVLLIAVLVLTYQFGQLSGAILSIDDDFLEYWTAGQLIVTGQNPYSPEQMFALQKELGRLREYPLMMYNPPWTLTIALLFSFFSYPTARVLWFLIMVAAILLSADVAWRHYGGPSRYRWLAGCLALTFIPTLISLNIGQINPLVLLGLSGFLYFSRRAQWGWAGSCLAVATIKPQLLYLLWPALLLWVVRYRQWSLVGGGMIAVMAGLVIPLILYPELLNGYVDLTLYYPAAVWWGPPTWGSLLRVWFGEQKVWLQWLPATLGFVWLLIYWHRNRFSWDWDMALPHILLVSFLTGVYGWVHDQTVLILVIVHVAILLLNNPKFVIVLFYILFNGLLLAVQITGTGGINEVWTILVWSLLYVWVYLSTNIHDVHPTDMPRLPPGDSRLVK